MRRRYRCRPAMPESLSLTGNLPDVDFSLLRRDPDVGGADLPASDAADRLILDEAADLLAASAPHAVTVFDDAYGALAIGATVGGATAVRSHQDLITGERALARNAERFGVSVEQCAFDAAAVAGARVVVMRLPRSLDRLAEVAALIAAHADPEVVVVAGGRIKHMSVAMNDILGEVFDRVDVSHARQKSRVLFARGPRGAQKSGAEKSGFWPQTQRHDDLGLTLAAHGGVFAGTRVDVGTRFLLSTLDPAVPYARTAVDLACGSGLVASWLATSRPSITVLATDRSAAAAASARATAAANNVADRVTVTQSDGLESVADASQELVILNPPFHSDAAISTDIARHLFVDAGRALAPGGELWCVWNSHLRYRPVLEKEVGPTRQIARNSKFTVTASRKP
ncbi:methyltransferase [Gordonia sp. (in: high G+C Gram-positive bacteria)]|uniref:class I SAM-dependent methyltransferase n=1 Tax=Gordonia sp. (in: high G+C Gram-positive bacteria) TaxID=84139 RepID=UPI00169731EB|nr:methyltransferase [Gordonia sp. (in: high G+C Gram-positive bacteria)]NLG47581.1 methyltransferase [Gordonia sp. (in: high G+C Gram-positive bacteria)]